MDLGRVKYYSSNDWAYGQNLDKITTLEIPSYFEITINDAIEFYEISKYFKSGVRSRDWSDADFEEYLKKSKLLQGQTNHFFSSLTDQVIILEYAKVDSRYRSVFWELYEECKLFKKITPDTFDQLIHSDHISPTDLFKHKMIVKTYGSILRSFILENEELISIVLHWYEQNFNGSEKLYRPLEFSSNDVCQYLMDYIHSSHPNPNRLQSIMFMSPIKDFPITDEIRLEAKRSYYTASERLSETGISVEYGIQLSFSPDQNEITKVESKGTTALISYSSKWLLDSLDNPSILNNFIYLFEYTDIPQMRFLHVSKHSQVSAFESLFQDKSSKIYPVNSTFHFLNELAYMQMNAYYHFLKDHNIRLEDVLENFFTQYLQQEFGLPELRVTFPSEGTSYSEKCSLIAPAFESVLKQFQLYVRHGIIDFELVSMSSTPIQFKDISSRIPKKYVYGQGKDFQQLSFMLFSDQCLLAYVPRLHETGKEYECLCDLLLHETVNLSDYMEGDRKSFEYLVQHGIIEFSKDDDIRIKDYRKVGLLKDLYNNEVISRWHHEKPEQEVLDDWVDQGIVVEKSSLFSTPEADFLTYMLRSEYNNGLELRNRYLHGVQQVILNENDHMKNYFEFLRLFVLMAIKINDDCDLQENIQE